MATRRSPSLSALEARVEERHLENLRRFDTQDLKLDEIKGSVDSLLSTRSFTKGIVKTLTLLAGGVATIVSIIIGWARG